jgi:hypothetical protein
VTYVQGIGPRLTPVRDVAPSTAAEMLREWTRDLCEELTARCRLMSEDDLRWQPHPDQNNNAVTVWHVARWLDVLGSRLFTGGSAAADAWHEAGWRDVTGYEPDGIGYLGLGTLTGYTSEEMRAVPNLDAESLITYVGQAGDRLNGQIDVFDDVTSGPRIGGRTPYQIIGPTLQGSFGHVGEIDALVALRDRLGGRPFG